MFESRNTYKVAARAIRVLIRQIKQERRDVTGARRLVASELSALNLERYLIEYALWERKFAAATEIQELLDYLTAFAERLEEGQTVRIGVRQLLKACTDSKVEIQKLVREIRKLAARISKVESQLQRLEKTRQRLRAGG